METSDERSLRWGQERDRLFLTLRNASVEEKIEAYEALGRRLAGEARGARERLEIQRRITEDLLRVTSEGPWARFAPYLRRMERLGYTALDRRLMVCVLAAQAARGSTGAVRVVKRLITEAERRAPRSRDRSMTKEEIQHVLGRARKFAGLSADEPDSAQSPSNRRR